MIKRKSILNAIIVSFTLLTSLLIFSFKAYAEVPVVRLAGQDRYATAIEISKAGWERSQNVVLATGEDFPDALCAAPLAKQLDAPILLTRKAGMNTALENELDRLGVKNIYIIGGTGAVSKDVEKKLINKGVSTVRLYGSNRYATSLEIAKYMKEKFSTSSDIVLATGENFPDALSIAPVASKKDMPIILTGKDSLPPSVKAYIEELKAQRVYIIGGTGVISSSIEKQFSSCERLWGKDRFETNLSILSRFEREFDFRDAYIATGSDFPDALAGTALASKTSSPLILVGSTVPAATKNYISSRLSSICSIKVLGGKGIIPDNIVNGLAGAQSGSDIVPVSNEKGGNSLANINNGGLAAYKDGWIYYRNEDDQGILYKMKPDGSQNTRLRGDSVTNINVVGDYVYYTLSGNPLMAGAGDSEGVYMVSVNGSSDSSPRKVITTEGATFLYVEPGVVYYGFKNGALIRWERSEKGSYKRIVDSGTNYWIQDGWVYYLIDYEGNKLYKVRTSGDDKSLVIDGSIDSFNIYDNKIYYIDKNDRKLYRANLDGSSRSVIISDKVLDINITGGFIYYVNGSEGSSLYRTRVDGTGKVKITNSIVTPTINVAGNELVYIAAEGRFATIRKNVDDSNSVLISDDASYLSKVDDGWIYYINLSDNNRIYKVNSDGTERISLGQYTTKDMDIEGGYIYYSNDRDAGRLYRVKTDGTGNFKVCDDPADNIDIDSGWVYYRNVSTNTLYKVKADGSEKAQLALDNPKNIIVDNGWVYYYTEGASGNEAPSTGSIYKIKTDGTGRAKVSDCQLGQMYISYNYLYYSDINDNGAIYKVQTDSIASKNKLIPKSQYFAVKGTAIYVYEVGGMDYGNMTKYYTDGTYNGSIGIGGGLLSFIPGFDGEYYDSPLNASGGMISFLPDTFVLYYNSVFYDLKMRIIKTDGTAL